MGFLKKLFGRPQEESPSRDVAKERLRLVLTHDRAGISPKMLDTLKDEIITVISRHVKVDVEGVQVTVSQSGHESSLVADIPLLIGRDTREG